MANNTPIVQYADSAGNKAYALTHWNAIQGKPDLGGPTILTSPNGTRFALSVDDEGTITAKEVTDA
ncbi:hypothetical protein ABU186_01745 [Weissella paramesenteroides]